MGKSGVLNLLGGSSVLRRALLNLVLRPVLFPLARLLGARRLTRRTQLRALSVGPRASLLRTKEGRALAASVQPERRRKGSGELQREHAAQTHGAQHN